MSDLTLGILTPTDPAKVLAKAAEKLGVPTAVKPYRLAVTFTPSLTGVITEQDGEYRVSVACGVLARTWAGSRSNIEDAVSLMGRIQRNHRMIA